MKDFIIFPIWVWIVCVAMYAGARLELSKWTENADSPARVLVGNKFYKVLHEKDYTLNCYITEPPE